MKITPSSLISSILLISLVILIICVLLNSNKLIKNISFPPLFIGTIIVVFRLFFPVEFTHSISFPSSNLLPKLFHTSIGMHIFYFIVIAWLLVAAIKIIYTLIQYIHLIYFTQKLSFVQDKQMNELIEKIIKERKSMTHDFFRIVKSVHIDAPMILCVSRPIVLMPDLDFTNEEIYYILKHEIEHYCAHHLTFKKILSFLCCIYWWNPIVYFLCKTMNQCMEIQIDRIVTNELNEKQKLTYLSCLLKVAKISTKRYGYVLPFSNINHTPLKQRFQLVLYKRTSFSKRICTSIILILLLFLLFIPSYLLVFEPYIITEDVKEETFVLNDNFYLVEENKSFSLYDGNKFIASIEKLDDNLNALPKCNKPKGGD